MSEPADVSAPGRRVADWAAVRMLRRHRQWAILITAAVGLLVVAGAVTLTVVESVSKGPAYQKAADYVRSGRGSGLTRMQLGAVLGFGLGVTGPISETGKSGRANLSFDVHGNWRSGRVKITEVKRGSRWFVTGGVLTVDGKRFQMPCAPPISPTSCLLS